MLEVRLLGNFDVRRDGKPIAITSRPAQSLFAYLILSPGTSHRREKLAGMLWPDSLEETARDNLRHALWRVRKALPSEPTSQYLLADDMSIGFNASADYWLDAAGLEKVGESATADELLPVLSAYQGELLPGFYDEWVALEREHLQSVFEHQMARLLALLQDEGRWLEVLDWGERWIKLGQKPEPAYRALMSAHAAKGDMSKVAATYERCVKSLGELVIEPSEQTQELFENLKSGKDSRTIKSEEFLSMPRQVSASTIPIPLTSFVGREKELKEIARLLSTSRLVTLTGVGGCGKTRLALRVVAELTNQYENGVYWVELARLADSTLVPQAVAKVLNVVEQPGNPLMDTLLGLLGDRQILLVLDNCEHLLGACAQLVEAFADCPNIRVLATAREPLGVIGEKLYPVLPLALPAAHLSIDEIRRVESVQLFVERARSILPTFSLTPDNAEFVSTICRDLDGIPLAIELASARVGVLNVKQIQERLDHRLDLLVSTARAGERHRTLRAAMDWSYDLLSSSERLLLQRLALFTAGFALSTAESACAWGEIQREDVLDLLSSLVSKSLVAAETLQGSEARYRLLETIRQYAQEKLRASGEWISTHDHYLACWLRLTEEVAPKLREQYQQLWFDWLETENDNIRAALAWALEQQRIEAGMRIGTALYSFWQTRAYVREGHIWYERFLHQTKDNVPLAVHVNALTWSSVMARFLGDAVTATARGQEAVALCEAAGEDGKPLLAVALIGEASGAWAAGDYQTAYAIGERLIEVYRELGDPVSLGIGIMVQGELAIGLGKYNTAQLLLEESMALARAAGDKYRIAVTLNYMGDLARSERQVVQAQSTYEESLSILRELGATKELPATLHNLAYACLYQGDLERAQALFYESLEAQRAQNSREGVLKGLLGYAALASATGMAAESARLYAAAVASGRGNSAILWPPEKIEYEHYIELARVKLSEADFEAEQTKGRALSMEQAIEYALNLPFGLPKPLQTGLDPLQALTEREREVVTLIARGLSNGEIADELVLSKRTVEHHMANILSKLGFANRAQIVRWAIENGLTDTAR